MDKTNSNKVTLIFKKEYRVQVDRHKLIESCDYFRNLLCGGFKESFQQEIDINLEQDCCPETYETFVEYVEKKKLTPFDGYVRVYIELLQLSDLWLFESLFELMKQFLHNLIDFETVIYIYKLAKKYKIKSLLKQCLSCELDEGELIDKKVEAVFAEVMTA